MTQKWTLKWTPKQWKDTLNYEDGGHYSKNVDRKGGQKLNKVDRKVDKKRKKVDRKFRMTPQNDSQSDTKNDTKN